MPKRTANAATLTITVATLTACAPMAPEDYGSEQARDIESSLTSAQKQPRYERIRDSLRSYGVARNGYLFAGIVNTETGLAHCWSEATWACKGPSSPDCGGGPVIAGSADGPCSIQEGGLGMFQFDAGTHGATIAKYGPDVVTIDGQLQSALDYVVNMVKNSVYTTNAETHDKALAWLNEFDAGDPVLRDQWIKTVLRYYNGCQPQWSCWSPRYETYSDGLSLAIAEPGGLGFWAAGDAAPPREGTQAFVYPNQQHFLHGDGGGNVRHHFWDGNLKKVITDTWGTGTAGQPVTFVQGTSQHVFARGEDGSLAHWFWDPKNGSGFDNWAPSGDLAGDPAAITVGDYQGVWAVDHGGMLQHWYWTPDSNGVRHDTWGAGVVGRPSVFVTKTGQVHAFARGISGTLEHWWWTPNAGLKHDTWGSGLAGDPAALVIGDFQAVWAVDGGGNLQHWYWGPKTGGVKHDTWGSGVVGRPSVFVTQTGAQHAFVRGTGGTLEHWWWTPNAGLKHDTWGDGIAEDPTAALIGEQQHVWALGVEGSAKHWWRDPAVKAIQHDDWGK